MKILFDLVTTQFFVGGAQEYIRKVFYTLLESLKPEDEVWMAHDSSVGKYAYADLTPQALADKVAGEVDLAGKTLSQVVHDQHFDTLFIGCGQYWGPRYDVDKVDSRVICVVHDLCDEEVLHEHLNYYLKLDSVKGFLKRVGRQIMGIDKKSLNRMTPIVELLKRNSDARLVTVSDFSRYSLQFQLNIPEDRIRVLWSPERVGECQPEIENAELRALIESKTPYILMTNTNRELKNAKKAIMAFARFVKEHPQYKLVTVGYPSSAFAEHQILPYLSESDLINAQKHCHAFLFPSYFEGFGYPPVEAMRWGKPVLASNVTSMPEILADAPIWFSPYYTSDIYSALCRLTSADYNTLSGRSLRRYYEVAQRQQHDLSALIDLILDE